MSKTNGGHPGADEELSARDEERSPGGEERPVGSEERSADDAERARTMLRQLRRVHALDIGRDMVVAAFNYSYPKLGLSDETRSVRHLGDVRLSIELVRAVLGVLEREHLDEVADLRDALAQMQLAYAHAVQLANAERAGAEGGGVEGTAATEADDRPAPGAAASDAPPQDAAPGDDGPAGES